MINFVTFCLCLILQVRRMRTARHVARMGGIRNLWKMFLGTPQDKITLRGTTRTSDGNIKISIEKLGCESVKWI